MFYVSKRVAQGKIFLFYVLGIGYFFSLALGNQELNNAFVAGMMIVLIEKEV
ncbi:MAG: hypothetical protein WCO84_04900 [bacterium]